MAKTYNLGDKVNVRMFNEMDNAFYGPVRQAEIIRVESEHRSPSGRVSRPYQIRYNDTGFELWIARKEIKNKISS